MTTEQRETSGLIHRRSDCRACGSRDLELIFSLKPSPIGDAFVTAEQLDEAQPSYPIDLMMCSACGLAQLADVIAPEVLYGQYLYVTGSSLGLTEHFRTYAENVKARCRLRDDTLVVDIGSNDGTLLSQFQALGSTVLGIEPAEHVAAAANARGIPTVPGFFGPALATRVANEHGRAALITANNVFANIDDLGAWIEGLDQLLASDGVFVFESYYLADLVRNMVFDFIYHEHLSAFSVRPVQLLFQRAGFELVAAEPVATKGGSLRYFVQRAGGSLPPDGSIATLLADEFAMGLYERGTYAAFASRVDALKYTTKEFVEQRRREGCRIAGFGASITGTTLIHHFEIGACLDYLIDDNEAKQGRYSPGLHLPVLPSSAMYERKPDYVVALAWRYAEPFIGKHRAFLEGGGAFVVPVPEFRVIRR